jgi:hypothetical protein
MRFLAQALSTVWVTASIAAVSPVRAAETALPVCEVVVEQPSLLCPGDCSGDGEVTVNDVVRGVTIALGEADPLTCCSADSTRDTEVTVDEVIGSLQNALLGCTPRPAPAGWYECPGGAEVCNVAGAAGLDVASFGKGVSIVDFDGDGWDDVWFSDSDVQVDPPERLSGLLRSHGDGTFTRFDAGIDLRDLLYSWGAAFADYDADGDADVLLVNGGYAGEGRLELYRNDMAAEGRFTRVTEVAGIDAPVASWWGASWADYDGDGALDFVASPVVGRIWLYRNQGDGTFVETTATAGLPVGFERTDGKNPVWFDYDLDSLPDLFVGGPYPHLYHNAGGGRFEDVTPLIMIGDMRTVPFVFVAAAADFDQNGYPDLYLGRFMMQDAILLNQGDGSFVWRARDAGLDMLVGTQNSSLRWADPNWAENSMGLSVEDIDDDGWPDIQIGTGNPFFEFDDVVYCNRTRADGALQFERCGREIIDGHGPSQTHGIAVGDLDRDGDADLLYNLGGMAAFGDEPAPENFRRRNAFYSRDPATRARTASLRLEGTRGNRDAIGARIAVHGGATRHYDVTSMQGFQSQGSAWKLVSLAGEVAGEVVVTWPDGRSCRTFAVDGERLRIVERRED